MSARLPRGSSAASGGLSLEFALLKSVRVSRGVFVAQDLEALAVFVLIAERVEGVVSLTLDLTGHDRIRQLNRHYRGVDRTTDVISFRNDLDQPLTTPARGRTRAASPTGVTVDGDLAINVEQAAIQATKMRHPTRREVRLLLIHGVLHLLGYTDYDPAPRRQMFKRQNELLRRWEKQTD